MSLQPSGRIKLTTFEFEWKINIISKLDNKPGETKIFRSPSFFTHCYGKEIDWCVVLISRTAQDKKDYLEVKFKNLSCYDVEAKAKVCLLDKHKIKLKKWKMEEKSLFKQKEMRGTSAFVEKNFLMNLKNDVFDDGMITFEGGIVTEKILNRNQQSFVRLDVLDDFEMLLLSEQFSDFTVVSSDGREFHVHRNILATRSPAFEAMLVREMAEKDIKMVKIEDVRYEVLLEILRFIYSSKVNKIEEILCEILYASEKYSIAQLKLLCEETMLMSINKKNAIEYLIEADQNNASNVKYIIEFVVKNSRDLVKTSRFKSLGTYNPDLMYQVVNALVYYKKKTEKN